MSIAKINENQAFNSEKRFGLIPISAIKLVERKYMIEMEMKSYLRSIYCKLA